MPSASPKWFDENYYAEQKIDQMNAMHWQGRENWDRAGYESELNRFNVTAYENFEACNTKGYISSITLENINVAPNKFFDVSVYIQNYVNWANSDGDYSYGDIRSGQWTVQNMLTHLFQDLRISAWAHYQNAGVYLGINPSNEFDTDRYLEDRASAMNNYVNTDGTVGWDGITNWTKEDVIDELTASDDNPITDYFKMCDSLNLSVYSPEAVTVVDVPENWTPWGYLKDLTTPDNPQIPDTPDSPEPNDPQNPVNPDIPNQPITPDRPVIEPDRFEVEGNNNQTDATVLSTNSGTLKNLTITADDQDWFKISLSQKGTAENFVHVHFDQSDATFNLALYDKAGNIITAKSITSGDCLVSLDNIVEGEYFAVITGENGAIGSYSLEWNTDVPTIGPVVPDDPQAPDYNFEIIGHGGSMDVDNDSIAFLLYINGNLPNDYPLPNPEDFTMRSKNFFGEVKSIEWDQGRIKIVVDREPYHTTNFGGVLLEYKPSVSNENDILGKVIGDYFYEAYQNGNAMNTFNFNSYHVLYPSQASIPNLQIAFDNDVDYWEFTIDRRQTIDDYINIQFNHNDGDLNAILYKTEDIYKDGQYIESIEKPIYYATSQTDNEIIKLNNLVPDGDKETFRLKVYGEQDATNNYAIDYQINSEIVIEPESSYNYSPVIMHSPKYIGLSKEWVVNTSVGLKTLLLPTSIHIYDSMRDTLTVTLESNESVFSCIDSSYEDYCTISNNGHRISFTRPSGECDDLLKTIALEPTATAISKVNGDVDPFMTVNIAVTDGTNDTTETISYVSNDFISSYVRNVETGECIWVNGIDEDRLKSDLVWSKSCSDDSIFDADKISMDEGGNMCWAATVSDMLAWSKWGDIIYNQPDIYEIAHPQENDIEDLIFSWYRNAFHNEGYNMNYGIKWFFDGTVYNSDKISIPGKGNLIKEQAPSSVIRFDDVNDMIQMRDELHAGSAVGLTLTTKDWSPTSGACHALTCWGYAHDDSLYPTDVNYYTGLIVSDSNDWMWTTSNTKFADEMMYIPIKWSNEEQTYILQNYENNAYRIYSATILPMIDSRSTPLSEYGDLQFYVEGIEVTDSENSHVHNELINTQDDFWDLTYMDNTI